ncbi:MAG TPA: SH3 domain-containing protein [Xenococcaceae cyanobacterium]
MNPNQSQWQSSLKVISNLAQFILGFVLGVSLIAGAAIGAGYYYFTKMSSKVPQKPIYEAEKVATTITEPETVTDTIAATSELAPETNSDVPAEPETAAVELPENAYYARVTWPQGLSLRAEPSINSARIGGIGYDAEIIILEQSADRQWQRVQIPWNQQEGWVKAGNTERVSY